MSVYGIHFEVPDGRRIENHRKHGLALNDDCSSDEIRKPGDVTYRYGLLRVIRPRSEPHYSLSPHSFTLTRLDLLAFWVRVLGDLGAILGNSFEIKRRSLR